jgi:hypothetical protein
MVSYEDHNESFSCIKCGEFDDWLRGYQVLIKDFAPRSCLIRLPSYKWNLYVCYCYWRGSQGVTHAPWSRRKNVQHHFLDAKQSIFLNAIHGIMKQQQPSLYASMSITWLITLGGTKCTMGIRSFNVQGQVRRKGEIGLNQSLICIHTFPPLSPQFFIFAPLQLISKKNYF